MHPTRINEGRDLGLFAAEVGQEENKQLRLAVDRMMPLTSDAPEVTQETKREDSESDRKLRTIELRPTEVEGREENEVIVEDAGVVRAANAMGSPKVDAVAGDAGSKGTPPDKVASSSSSSCKGGMDSGGSPAAPAIKSGSGSGSTRGRSTRTRR